MKALFLLAILPFALAQDICFDDDGDEVYCDYDYYPSTSIYNSYYASSMNSGNNGAMIAMSETYLNMTPPVNPSLTNYPPNGNRSSVPMCFANGKGCVDIAAAASQPICTGVSGITYVPVVNAAATAATARKWSFTEFWYKNAAGAMVETAVGTVSTVISGTTVGYLCRIQAAASKTSCTTANGWNSTTSPDDGVYMVQVSTAMSATQCLWLMPGLYNPPAGVTCPGTSTSCVAAGFTLAAAVASSAVPKRYLKALTISKLSTATGLSNTTLYFATSVLSVNGSKPFTEYTAFVNA